MHLHRMRAVVTAHTMVCLGSPHAHPLNRQGQRQQQFERISQHCETHSTPMQTGASSADFHGLAKYPESGR
jgi:hypothetical protein